MQVKVAGSAVYGVEAITITIEVSVSSGTNIFLVGLPDNTIKESIRRVEAAIRANDFHMPRTKVVINLAPADIRKSGSAFDLPIAIGILAATEQLPNPDKLAEMVIMGELGLDGTVHTIKGALPIALQAQKDGFKTIVVPLANAREAGIAQELKVYGISHLRDLVGLLENEHNFTPVQTDLARIFGHEQQITDNDFREVKGQENIKRALEIAAAGGHNAILIGPPGAGKTMLARRLPGILPPLTLEEALETTRIHSVAGKLPAHTALIARRPFRAPHHSISHIALAGGGGVPQPGEISLAHNGVLFLDELPEYQRQVLEIMRQPMEERKVTISRAKMTLDFPAGFMLIASMNPCPCGYFNHPEKSCSCPPGAVQKYLNKISGPLLDRIDLHVEVTPLSYNELSSDTDTEPSVRIRERVIRARELQAKRFAFSPGIYANAQMETGLLKKICVLPASCHQLMRNAMEKLHLSARAYDRILKVSRTIADLDGSAEISPQHLAEAIQYRSLDRTGWGS